jgi:hypothetical protein
LNFAAVKKGNKVTREAAEVELLTAIFLAEELKAGHLQRRKQARKCVTSLEL